MRLSRNSPVPPLKRSNRSHTNFALLILLRPRLYWHARGRSRRLSCLLLLLELYLALLHFLKQFLRSLHCWGIRLRGRLFRFTGYLLSIFIGIVFRRCHLRITCISRVGLWLLGSSGRLRESRCRLSRRTSAGLVRTGSCDQDYARQDARVLRRSQQHIVVSRAIQEFRNDFLRRSGAQMRHDALFGIRYFNFRSRLLPHGAKNIRQRRVGRHNCQLPLVVSDMRRDGGHRIQRNLLNRSGRAGRQRLQRRLLAFVSLVVALTTRRKTAQAEEDDDAGDPHKLQSGPHLPSSGQFRFGGTAGQPLRRFYHSVAERYERTQFSLSLERHWARFLQNFHRENGPDFAEKPTVKS